MSRMQYNKYSKVQYSTGVQHSTGHTCPRNRSAVALAGVLEHRSGRACSRNRSAVAPGGRTCPPPPPPPPPPPYKNFVLEIHTLSCACSISDPLFSCLLQKLERDSHLSQQNSIRTKSPVLIFQSWIGTDSF